eukprot:3775397-Prymnesium_polylepis.2
MVWAGRGCGGCAAGCGVAVAGIPRPYAGASTSPRSRPSCRGVGGPAAQRPKDLRSISARVHVWFVWGEPSRSRHAACGFTNGVPGYGFNESRRSRSLAVSQNGVFVINKYVFNHQDITQRSADSAHTFCATR